MKVLFFGLDYHDYTRNIINEMRAAGGDVNYVDIQPRSLIFKVLRTAGRGLYDQYLEVHHGSAVRQSKSTAYDKVVFLQAHQMSIRNLTDLRAAQPKAEFTLYNWDSLSNHDYRVQAKWFDRVLTFDPVDARNNGYGYLPLFCSRFMQGLRRDRVEPASLFMVGNIVKPGRYEAVESFRRYCAKSRLTFKQHLKVSPVVWFNLVRSGLYPRDVSFRQIDKSAFCDMIETSSAAFDFANHSQTGQTMRMMENLCLGKKIVTSNTWVKQEPFYSPDRIHVFDGLNYSGVADFMFGDIVDKDADFSDYHIQSFVRKLLGLSLLSAC
ncbi:hypothetical protein [Limnohabitans sp. Bal53]|uniref:hypothetical protein n=1 Tax=Limnohabitans sp. Bal53 TaxID=1977910 RepID=UPI000D362948|nr:hypothetical protein [Limnohabitans sp. Bal53]PUE42382.1 hypothetical protein B9Z50_00450 [Limnohabitans sp. Bal53]